MLDLIVGTVLLRPYVFAFLLASLAAGAADLGWRRALGFGAWVLPVAWLAEFSSTRTGIPFGLYEYTGLTRGRELYLADVPFMDSLSFVFLAYAAFCLARAILVPLGAGSLAVTFAGGVLMMLLDVVIDPVAVRGSQWFLGHIFFYPQGGAYFGVPISNFVGWMVVGWLGIGGFALLAGGQGRRPGPGVALYYAVLAFNLVVTWWIGEWLLLGCGLALHAGVGAAVWFLSRRPAPWPGMESVQA